MLAKLVRMWSPSTGKWARQLDRVARRWALRFGGTSVILFCDPRAEK